MSEQEKEVAYGPRRVQLHDHAVAVARRSTVAIFAMPPDALPRGHGTGVLLRIADERLILTAGHVASDLAPEQLAVGRPNVEGAFVSLAGARVHVTASKAKSHGDDPLDLGVFQVSPEMAKLIEQSYSFLTTHHLDLVDPVVTNTMYVVVGYPSEGITIGETRGQVRELGLDFFPKRPKSFSPDNFDPESNFALDYGSKPFLRPDGVHVKPPDPHGLSGAGIWRAGRIEDQTSKGACPETKLVGIEIAYYEKSKAIKATRIRRALELISEKVPSLRQSLRVWRPVT